MSVSCFLSQILRDLNFDSSWANLRERWSTQNYGGVYTPGNTGAAQPFGVSSPFL